MKNKILLSYLLTVFLFYHEVEGVKNVTIQDNQGEVNEQKGAKNHEELTNTSTILDTHEGEMKQKKDYKQEDKIKLTSKAEDSGKNEYPLNIKITTPESSTDKLSETILNKTGQLVSSQTDPNIKQPSVSSEILPVNNLDHNKTINNKIEESEIEKHEIDSVSIFDCNVDGGKTHKHHEDDHGGRSGNHLIHHSDYHEDEDKEVKTLKEIKPENINRIKYKKTGTLVFYEEADQKNKHSEHTLPVLNIFVKKDKSINVERPVKAAKLKEDPTPITKVPKEETIISDITISRMSETSDVLKHTLYNDSSPKYNDGIPKDTEIKTITDTKTIEVKDILLTENNPCYDTADTLKNSLPDLTRSETDDEIGDIIIKNDDIQEVIQKHKDTNERSSELYTVADYSPQDIQSNQIALPQFSYDQTANILISGQNIPYNTIYGNDLKEVQKMQYVPPQTSYPQGYYTNQVNKFAKPRYSTATNLHNRANKDSTRYSKINDYFLNTQPNKINDYFLHKPNFPSTLDSQNLWNYQSQRYDNSIPQDFTHYGAKIANIPKPASRNPYTWNNQKLPIGFKSNIPFTQYAYEEIVQPDNDVDKIWRTWRKSEIILKGLKNKINSQQSRTKPRLLSRYAYPYRNEYYKAPLSKFNQRNRVIRSNGY